MAQWFPSFNASLQWPDCRPCFHSILEIEWVPFTAPDTSNPRHIKPQTRQTQDTSNPRHVKPKTHQTSDKEYRAANYMSWCLGYVCLGFDVSEV